MMQVSVRYNAQDIRELKPVFSRVEIVLSDGSEFAVWETPEGLFVYTPEAHLKVVSASQKAIILTEKE